jgi:GNAT superfamily N-acetyltransferase
MFLEEADRIFYIWEIQLEPSMRRKGLGKFVLQLCELFAWKSEFHKIGLFSFEQVVRDFSLLMSRFGV